MKYLNYFTLSKYIFINLKSYPKIISLNFNVVIHYKQKNKYFLFLNIICLLFFFDNKIKTRFYFKNIYVNLLYLCIKKQIILHKFLHNFVYIYLPLVDSFQTEFKSILKKKSSITFCFFKFPLFFELNILFTSLEYLIIILNNYKFQLEFFFHKQKNTLKNYTMLHYLKLPLIL